jgi:hypothetical protein
MTEPVAGDVFKIAEAQLKAMTRARDGLAQSLKACEERCDGWEAKVVAMDGGMTSLTASLVDAQERADDWKAKCIERDDRLESAEAEISRLTFALHLAKAHPDFEYITTQSQRKGDGNYPPEMDGGAWQPNPIVFANMTKGQERYRAWQRFEFYEEEYWRRVKTERPLPSQAEMDEESDANAERFAEVEHVDPDGRR